MTKYRVISKDFCNSNNQYTIWTDWTTKARCKQWIIGRCGHLPPYYIISASKTDAMIRRSLGLDY